MLCDRTRDVAIVACASAKDAKRSFDERELRRKTRARDGPSAEEIRVEKALVRIQEWKDVRELRVPKCAKCSGSMGPRRVETPEGVPHGLSLDAMASFMGSYLSSVEPSR